MRLAYALVAVLAGCSFDRGGVPSDDDGIDAQPPIDAQPFNDGDNPCVTWDAPNVDPCDATLMTPFALILGDGKHVYDTDTGELTDDGGTTTPAHTTLAQSGGPDVTALNLTGFSLSATGQLTVVGSRPLVLIVHGNATVDGTIDVSAQVDPSLISGSPGPGGNNLTVCGNSTGDPGGDASNNGGGGGGGGGYGDDGDTGGDGNGGGHGTKGAKGAKGGAATIEPLRGGCGGGSGGDDSVVVTDEGGAPGAGAGAIEITALGQLAVAGTIAANGTGGFGAQLAAAGGGGGGSGGAILLDAESATVFTGAKLCANGGGGGEGGQALSTSGNGGVGVCAEDTAAAGGAIEPDGGNGGDGGYAVTTDGTPGGTGAANAGGGGGGAGVGRIRVIGRTQRNVDDGATLSPAPAS